MTWQRTVRKNEQVNTYMIQDLRYKKAELLRLDLQDALITTAMGGVLSEQADLRAFRRILDVGCGPGGWLLQAAQMYPDMNLAGIDISPMMIESAHTQAKTQGLDHRVTFEVMDALKPLVFPENSFDLVNLRFGASFIRTWDWSTLLLEMQRVVRPGGIIRVTECEMGVQSTSQALVTLYEIGMRALYRSGHFFTQEAVGVTKHVEELLARSWYEEVHAKTYPLLFRAGTLQGEQFKENVRLMHETITPFVKKWTGLPENFKAIYQQAQMEMEKPDFCATWPHVTVWGSKPLGRK